MCRAALVPATRVSPLTSVRNSTIPRLVPARPARADELIKRHRRARPRLFPRFGQKMRQALTFLATIEKDHFRHENAGRHFDSGAAHNFRGGLHRPDSDQRSADCTKGGLNEALCCRPSEECGRCSLGGSIPEIDKRAGRCCGIPDRIADFRRGDVPSRFAGNGQRVANLQPALTSRTGSPAGRANTRPMPHSVPPRGRGVRVNSFVCRAGALVLWRVFAFVSFVSPRRRRRSVGAQSAAVSSARCLQRGLLFRHDCYRAAVICLRGGCRRGFRGSIDRPRPGG